MPESSTYGVSADRGSLRLGPPNLDGVRLLAMDEFAIQKGHRYATVVVDPERKRQQQDQGHQAGGLRLPGRRLLLPEDPGGLPRTWVKNLKLSRAAAGREADGKLFLPCGLRPDAVSA